MKKLFFVGFITIILVNLYQIDSSGLAYAQTVPTRTPVPKPTNTRSPGNGNNATNTPNPPTTTPTETPLSVTAVNTPEGGYYATAEPCSNQPTIIAANNTNVRSGPDTEFEMVGKLLFLEVRPIIGRAQNAEWWLITLADGTEGWVFNDVITVSGYTDIVPVISEPVGNGVAWNPTPNPSCTVTPTPVPTDTPIPTATFTATATPEIAEAAVPEKETTETAVPPTEPPTLVPQPTRITELTPTPLPTAVPIDPPNDNNSNNNNWLFIGAIGLLLVGGIVLMVKRS